MGILGSCPCPVTLHLADAVVYPVGVLAALLLGVGYVCGTSSLTIVSTGVLPLHLGALFMAAAIPLLLLWSRRAQIARSSASIGKW